MPAILLSLKAVYVMCTFLESFFLTYISQHKSMLNNSISIKPKLSSITNGSDKSLKF